jgi:hypothetical protein
MSANRRRHVRIQTDRTVAVQRVDAATGLAVGDVFSGRVIDVSAGGAHVHVKTPVWRGARLAIRVAWTEPQLEASLRARAVRVTAVDRGFDVSVAFQHATKAPPLELVRWVLQEASRTRQLAGRHAP